MTSFLRVLTACVMWVFVLSLPVSAQQAPTDADKKPATETPAAKDDAAKDKEAKKDAKADEKKPEAAPASHTVKREPFKIQVDLDGVFEAPTMTELVLRPKEWQGFSVLEAVEHGAVVKKGDILVKLDMEKIDRTLDDLRAELKLGEIALKQAEENFALLEKTVPMDLEAGERAQRIAEEERKYREEIGRPLAVKSQEMHMKMAHASLEYEKQELEQLEKMYKADDLTEETEKIVLKRQRDAVERAEWSVHVQEIEHEKYMKTDLPRQDRQLQDAFERRTMQWKKDRLELPQNLSKARLELERAKIQNARSHEKLAKMEADREAMIIKAPTDGTVYYGRCQRGKFSEAPVIAELLRRGGAIQPNQVFMTVVDGGPLGIRASVGEDQLSKVSKGTDGVATPTADPELKWDATVEEVSGVPMSPGSFDVRLSVAPEKPAKQIVAGMTCKVKLTAYSKDAIVVPPKTVFSDPDNDEEKYVWLLGKDNKAEKHPVKVGKQTDKAVEIRKGLSEGDKILLEAPKDEK